MRAICYDITKANGPLYDSKYIAIDKFGYAYETPTHYIHFFGWENYYTISLENTITESKNSAPTLNDWVKMRFGAVNIQRMNMEVGHTVDSVWRPSLYYWKDICLGLNIDVDQQISQEQSIRLLIQQLDELLAYIEPSKEGLSSYSHKTRELLILACTEVENQWKSILDRANVSPTGNSSFTTRDYVKILPKFFLNEFSLYLRNSCLPTTIKPFSSWSNRIPTQSLSWYDAYNATKHDRYNNFDSAKLIHVLNSVAANIVLYASRFSPIPIIESRNLLSPTFNQLFEIKIEDSDRRTFYLPLLDTTNSPEKMIFYSDIKDITENKNWIVDPLIL